MSCYSQPQPYRMHNVVHFSSQYTQAEKNVVLGGLNLWNEETGGRITFVEGDNPNIEIVKGTEAEAAAEDAFFNAHLKPGETPEHVIGLSNVNQEGSINFLTLYYVRMPDDPVYIAQVAAHEGGHQIGMIHVPQNETALMNPSFNLDLYGNDHLTHYDIDQFCQYWGCVDGNPRKPIKD